MTDNTAGAPLAVLPTFPVVVGMGARGDSAGEAPLSVLGDFSMAMLVEGEQHVELAGPVPTSGVVRVAGFDRPIMHGEATFRTSVDGGAVVLDRGVFRHDA